LDWNALKIFIAVAHSNSLVGAAESLGMSHSTVYRRLNEFEDQVGRLFERLNGRYELTEIGEEMLGHAQRISHSFADIEREIAGKDTQAKGTVRITAPSSFSYHELPKHLVELSKLHPDIQTELLVTNSELNMSNRLADIAIRVTPSPPEHLIGREIRRIKWGAYAAPEYLLQQGRPESLEGLQYHKIIGASGALSSHPAFQWLDKHHPTNVISRSDDLVAMSYLSQRGLGMALLPDDLMLAGLVRLFTFKHVKTNQLWVLTHPDLRKVERIKIVMRFLATALSEP